MDGPAPTVEFPPRMALNPVIRHRQGLFLLYRAIGNTCINPVLPDAAKALQKKPQSVILHIQFIESALDQNLAISYIITIIS